MSEPLSIHTRRVERLERKLRQERALTVLAVLVFVMFFAVFLASPALAIWSSLHGWDAGTPCIALGFAGLPLAALSGVGGGAWIAYREDIDTAGDLEQARDEYDRAVEQAVRDAR